MADQSDYGKSSSSNENVSGKQEGSVGSTTSNDVPAAEPSRPTSMGSQGSFLTGSRLGFSNPFSLKSDQTTSSNILAPPKLGAAVASMGDVSTPKPGESNGNCRNSLIDPLGRPVRNPFISPPRLLVSSDKSKDTEESAVTSAQPSSTNTEGVDSTSDAVGDTEGTQVTTIDENDSGEPKSSTQEEPSVDNQSVPSSSTTEWKTAKDTQKEVTTANEEPTCSTSVTSMTSEGDNVTSKSVEKSDSVASNSGISNPQPSTSTTPGGFVFGQKLEERVVNADTDVAQSNDKSDEKVASADEGSSSALMFGEVAQSSHVVKDEHIKSIEEAASEYQKLQESGPLLPEVAVTTGEEHEQNVLQIPCKLFCFSKDNSKWLERGRGPLRLNDLKDGTSKGKSFQSRLIMRTQGVQRVVLNTNIWPDMLCEQVTHKSLRISALEDGEVKIYLLSGAAKDMTHVSNAIMCRLQTLRSSTETAGDSAEGQGPSGVKRKSLGDADGGDSPKKMRNE